MMGTWTDYKKTMRAEDVTFSFVLVFPKGEGEWQRNES